MNRAPKALSEKRTKETNKPTTSLEHLANPPKALPVRGPRIEILDAQGRPRSPRALEFSYALGDKIELRCNSAPSKPAAKLRWYLNEHEITIPTAAGNSTPSAGGSKTTKGSHEVRVTPIELRQHYRGIQSAHSTLSLVLQQDDLINNKISFKCLASMRQEVAVRSKQLIVLMPSSRPPAAAAAPAARAGREIRISNQHHERPPNQRHSVTRLGAGQQPAEQNAARARLINNNNLLDEQAGELEQRSAAKQMLYIFEEANAALGASIIDTLAGLESYLDNEQQQQQQQTDSGAELPAAANQLLAGDNLELVQVLRERPQVGGSRARAGQTLAPQQRHMKPHGGGQAAALVRSPLYLDEWEPARPTIGWPPLEAGRLRLIAAPAAGSASTAGRFSTTSSSSSSNDGGAQETNQQQLEARRSRRLLVEKLLRNINCTCGEGAADTRLGWLLNDELLDARDTRFFPTTSSRFGTAGGDHMRQVAQLTIGFAAPSVGGAFDSPAPAPISPTSTSQQQAVSSRTLKSLLANYLGHAHSPASARFREPPASSATEAAASSSKGGDDRIRVACQATHSMLLHSSSEMLTFDFSPPPPAANFDGSTSSLEKFAASPSNVIQATSASQSSSSACSLSGQMKAQGSQSVVVLLATLVGLLSSSATSLSRRRQLQDAA